MLHTSITEVDDPLHDFKDWKFIVGVVLFISNFIVGKIALIILPLSIALAVIVYLFSWLMLFIGLSLCGKEGLAFARVCYAEFKQRIKRNAVRNITSIKLKKD
jgi:hypothetical protein